MTLNPVRWKLHWQILLSLVLSAVVALWILPQGSDTLVNAVETLCQRMGKVFMNALKMVIVPLVVSSIIAGVMRLGAEQGVGRMGGKTLLYYTLSGATAVLVGMVAVNLMGPGRIDAVTAAAMLGQGSSTATNRAMAKVEGKSGSDMTDILLRMFRIILSKPPPVTAACSESSPFPCSTGSSSPNWTRTCACCSASGTALNK